MNAVLFCGSLGRALSHLPRRQSFISRSTWQARNSSSFEKLRKELLSRELPILYDTPTPTQSHLLDATLADFLPSSPTSTYSTIESSKQLDKPPPLRQGHHLIYFPSPTRLGSLLSDATDPDQSPGEPFVRRMWAGGQIEFYPDKPKKLRLVGTRGACFERISDVVVRGLPEEEKIFVTIERRFSGTKRDQFTYENHFVKVPRVAWHDPVPNFHHKRIREFLLDDSNCALIERRNLVFMRKRDLESSKKASKNASRFIKPLHEPDFSHTITPTPELLFRFSALTWNAHSIHLDKKYCQDIEGHRNLLVHGPLSLVLMLEALNRHLASKGITRRTYAKAQRQITSIEYRNISPLYAEEEMRICCRDRGNEEWDVWVEGSNGGYAVKSVAKTREKQDHSLIKKIHVGPRSHNPKQDKDSNPLRD